MSSNGMITLSCVCLSVLCGLVECAAVAEKLLQTRYDGGMSKNNNNINDGGIANAANVNVDKTNAS
eukprot:7296781-Ditylum_brightwellii.AAC.1